MQEKGSQKQELLGAAGRAFLQNASNALGPSDQTELFFFFFSSLPNPSYLLEPDAFFFPQEFPRGEGRVPCCNQRGDGLPLTSAFSDIWKCSFFLVIGKVCQEPC